MRRLTPILATAALVASLAFAPATTAADTAEEADEVGATVALEATAAGATVAGTLEFGGAMTTGSDAAGDAGPAGVGLDIGDLRIEQRKGIPTQKLVFELDLLDTVEGEVAPTALYKVDVTGTLSLMAYRGPALWDYQLADFSDGYVSSDADGSFDGSTITWSVPADSFGAAGTQIAPGYLSSQGVSPAGLSSLQFSSVVQTDTANPIALFTVGGEVEVEVTDADGSTVDTATVTADRRGEWSYDGSDLAPGTYTVTATSAYADQQAETSVVLTVP